MDADKTPLLVVHPDERGKHYATVPFSDFNGDGDNGDDEPGVSVKRKCGRIGVPVLVMALTFGVVGVVVASTILDSDAVQSGYSTGAVAADAKICSDMGVTVLGKGGSAVDAAITSTLCIGVVNSHSSGIGGGGFMTIYDNGVADVIDFRETAPAASTQDMYTVYSVCRGENASNGGQDDESRCPSLVGGLAVGVPGLLRGLDMAHRKYGILPWSDLVQPVAKLAEVGVAVTGSNAAAISSNAELLQAHPGLNETFFPDGIALKEGDIIKRPLLAATLYRIANEGAEIFYSGDIADGIIDEVQNSSSPWVKGIMTDEDLSSYSALYREPARGTYQGHQIISAPPPASGSVLIMILNLLEGYGYTCGHSRDRVAEQRIVEAFKFGYAYRGRLSDPCCQDGLNGTCSNATHCNMTTAAFIEMIDKSLAQELRPKMWDNETHQDPEWYDGEYDVEPTPGTTHVSAAGPNNQAVAVTSTINTNFGAKIMTRHGIILNNEMDDFSSPNITNAFGFEPSPQNFIWPFKRPLSSTAPTIVVSQDGRFEIVLGASGGSKITTAVAQVILNIVSFCKSERDAVDQPRLHHQLLPMRIQGETDYPILLETFLESLGHAWSSTGSVGVCQTIASGAVGPGNRDSSNFYAASDYRRKPGAGASGF